MITYIVCEGYSDGQILKAILPEQLLHEVGIVPAEGMVRSLARSLIVKRQVPLAVVIDGDSVIPKLIQERTQDLESIVKSVAIDAPVKVWAFTPTIESLFFQDVTLLSKLLGYSPSQADLDLAVIQPKQVLDELIARSERIGDRSQFIEQLAHEDLTMLQSTPIIRELMDFLQAIRQPATV